MEQQRALLIARLFSPFTLLMAFFILAGLAISGYGCLVLYRAARSHSWPTVPGRVVNKFLDERVFQEDEGPSRRYRPCVKFEYELQGKRYTSTTRFIGDNVYSDEDWALSVLAVLDEYEAGTPVTVSYDPAEPDIAVIEPGVRRQSFAILWFGVGFIAFPVSLLVPAFSSRDSAESKASWKLCVLTLAIVTVWFVGGLCLTL